MKLEWERSSAPATAPEYVFCQLSHTDEAHTNKHATHTHAHLRSNKTQSPNSVSSQLSLLATTPPPTRAHGANALTCCTTTTTTTPHSRTGNRTRVPGTTPLDALVRWCGGARLCAACARVRGANISSGLTVQFHYLGKRRRARRRERSWSASARPRRAVAAAASTARRKCERRE